MKDSSMITECKTYGKNGRGVGGGVCVRGSILAMYDNSCITKCSASNDAGGGVAYEGGSGKIIMVNSSKITECTAKENGGGIFVRTGSFDISDAAKVIGNTVSTGETNNVYLNDPTLLNLVGDFTGRIGISNPSTGQFGSAESGASGAENFVQDNSDPLQVGENHDGKLEWVEGCMVTFLPMNGKEVWDQPVVNNTAIAKPVSPEWKEYVFCGWYNGDEKWDFKSKVTEDMTLTAKWAYPASSSESNGGATVILTETPATVQTVTPTSVATPIGTSTIKPTTQPTQKSPAPFVGIIAGLGAVALLIRMRR